MLFPHNLDLIIGLLLGAMFYMSLHAWAVDEREEMPVPTNVFASLEKLQESYEKATEASNKLDVARAALKDAEDAATQAGSVFSAARTEHLSLVNSVYKIGPETFKNGAD